MSSEYVPYDGFWSMDTWGQDLVATGDKKPVYIWQKVMGVSNVMEIISAAPEENLHVVVSPIDQHMILLGTVPEGFSVMDPMYIRWCDQGNYNDWETTSTNTAGGFRLTRGNKIVARIQSGQNTLIWTNTSMYRMWYTGPPNTFGKQPISDVGIIGQFAAIDYRGIAYWMTERGFYQYNGTVNNIPCEVHTWVFDQLDKDQMHKTHCGVNKRHNEVWWFFPTLRPDLESTDPTYEECDAYVALNTMDGTWHMGSLSRSAWHGTSAFNHWPYATNLEGALMDHERGYSANGEPMGEYLESYEIDLPSSSGQVKSLVSAYVPDFPIFEKNLESGDPPATDQELTVTIRGRGWSQESTRHSREMTVTADQKIIKPRLRARQISIRIDGTSKVTRWRMAIPRLDIKPDGER